MRQEIAVGLIVGFAVCHGEVAHAQSGRGRFEVQFGAGYMRPHPELGCCLETEGVLWLTQSWGIGAGFVHSVGTVEYDPPRLSTEIPGGLVLGVKNYHHITLSGRYRRPLEGNVDLEIGFGTFFDASLQGQRRLPDGQVTGFRNAHLRGVSLQGLLGGQVKGPFGIKAGGAVHFTDEGPVLEPKILATVAF
jgi:hypothetical protein